VGPIGPAGVDYAPSSITITGARKQRYGYVSVTLELAACQWTVTHFTAIIGKAKLVARNRAREFPISGLRVYTANLCSFYVEAADRRSRRCEIIAHNNGGVCKRFLTATGE
jgi:hypothetical protein